MARKKKDEKKKYLQSRIFQKRKLVLDYAVQRK
jgi:hypothetical protein